MKQNNVFLITIITILFGIIAGGFSYYQNKKIGQTVTADIISTIIPAEQDKSSSLAVQLDSLAYNQTLVKVLTSMNMYDRVSPNLKNIKSISWEADLNSAIIRVKAEVENQVNIELIPADLMNIAQERSNNIINKHYGGKIISKLSLLNPTLPTSSRPTLQNYWLMTVLGSIVGFFIGALFFNNKGNNKKN